MKYFATLFLSIIGLLSGCASQNVISKPNEITLESAFVSLGTGLAGLKTAEHSVQSGLVPSQVVITFNIAANASDSGNLTLSASVPTTTPINANLNAADTVTQSANRGNQVTVTMTNLLWAPKDTILGTDPSTLDQVLNVLKEHGYDFYLVQASSENVAVQARINTLLRKHTDGVEKELKK